MPSPEQDLNSLIHEILYSAPGLAPLLLQQVHSLPRRGDGRSGRRVAALEAIRATLPKDIVYPHSRIWVGATNIVDAVLRILLDKALCGFSREELLFANADVWRYIDSVLSLWEGLIHCFGPCGVYWAYRRFGFQDCSEHQWRALGAVYGYKLVFVFYGCEQLWKRLWRLRSVILDPSQTLRKTPAIYKRLVTLSCSEKCVISTWKPTAQYYATFNTPRVLMHIWSRASSQDVRHEALISFHDIVSFTTAGSVIDYSEFCATLPRFKENMIRIGRKCLRQDKCDVRFVTCWLTMVSRTWTTTPREWVKKGVVEHELLQVTLDVTRALFCRGRSRILIPLLWAQRCLSAYIWSAMNFGPPGFEPPLAEENLYDFMSATSCTLKYFATNPQSVTPITVIARMRDVIHILCDRLERRPHSISQVLADERRYHMSCLSGQLARDCQPHIIAYLRRDPGPIFNATVRAWVRLLRVLQKRVHTVEKPSREASLPRTRHSCSLRDCFCHVFKSLHIVKKCQCGKVAYCDKHCQEKDWNEGGHKNECLALAK